MRIEYTSAFQPIMSIHYDIDERKLLDVLYDIGYNCIKNECYKLPNGKEILRMDFKRVI